MDKEHKKVLHKYFTLKMKEYFPKFVGARMGGGLSHTCQVSNGLAFVVEISAFKDETFDVLIGKEIAGQSDRLLPFPTDLAQIYTSGAFTFPLSNFWSIESLPWGVVHEASYDMSYPTDVVEPKIKLLIDDVIDKLQVYAIPYWERVAAGEGISPEVVCELLGGRS